MNGGETYVCRFCGKTFARQYKVKNPSWKPGWLPRKVYGTEQLMRLHAKNNFRRHEATCRLRKEPKP